MMLDLFHTRVILGQVLFAPWLALDCTLRGKMGVFHAISGMITLGLLAYLFAVLLNPERFG